MNWLTQLKIGPRLALGFGAVLALSLVMMVLGIGEVTHLGSGLNDVTRYESRIVVLLNSVHNATLERAIAARNLVFLSDSARGKAEIDNVMAAKKEIDTALQELASLSADPQIGQPKDRDAMNKLKAFEARYWPVAEGIVKLLKEGERADAIARLTNECIPMMAEATALLDKISEENERGLHESVLALQDDASRSRIVLATLGAVLLVLGALLAWAIQRSVVVPLHAAAGALRHVADGDLTQTIQSSGRDEVADMMGELGRMQDHLRKVVGSIRNGVDSVGVASQEIATGNQDLSHRTEQTASNLQQTASAMEQLTSTVKQSADSARQANQLATSAADVAQRGGDVVAQVVGTMDEINASSKKIVDIIGVIDGIAFQTNILALNAAVEAARAGEQGRGFAVVASEVRSLAQRSADAAKEIKSLIGTSVDKVENGSRLVADAGRTMSEIVGSVQRVTDIIGEISAAAAEQSQGINQVNGSVNQLDQMTQQNAALVEQSAAAAESLRGQAAQLAQVVGAFRLDGATLMRAAQADAHSSPASPTSRPKPAMRAAATVLPKPRKAPAAAAAPAPQAAPASATSDSDWEAF